MKATAVAPANIAFIKYWGKKNAEQKIPYNPSISMNLSNCFSTTTVEFSKDLVSDEVTDGFDKKRILAHIDRLRNLSGIYDHVKVTTENNFPQSSGIASSASGFAALTVAAAQALNMSLSEKELTALARLGSGSACRSIPDGFVKWEDEFAYSLYPHDYWDLRDCIVIVDTKVKKISSSAGHETVLTSPLFKKRLEDLPLRIEKIERAFREKDFTMLGEVIEEDCLDMHAVMQSQLPPLLYWNDATRAVINKLKESRLPAYFTVDAGPNVHIICEGNDEQHVLKLFEKEYKVIRNKPAQGAHSI